ncbi:U11/U12 small nuclear ribonucleoprotein 25 kDa protein [Momordica charantia]|uniref:U11/U12 small nuclear ribonucleoprotein 25 kDa protein n=1 Tax=Momordica charantia TaxID=3673 RepID=A0A6J1CH74_MOMCH|nr:U11/U12 small nuclear ribonucleoprotein 25 kDa protein [Momordica charantia]XP_022140949.1 U11/U12 small nuclear ribonucleoprotein 25 kDa protein [Momordica charantia]
MKEQSDDKLKSSRNDEEKVVDYHSNNVKKVRLNSTLAALLDDPILADVPKNPTLSDVDTLISLELGSAMRISVLKLDGAAIDVAIMNSATLKDLKLTIKKKVNDMEQSKMGHRHISWKHVWENFCLAHHNEKLLDEGSALQDFGIRNNSQVHFVPYVASKNCRRHSRRRKHRFFHGLNKRA